MIKYHDNLNGQQYGNDGCLTNNWDPDGPFDDDEYVKVYFRLDTEAYYHPDRDYNYTLMFDNRKEREKFYDTVGGVLKGLGWSIEGVTNAVLDKSHLFIHPQNISGTVHKWEVKYIAEHLTAMDGIKLRWVDLYDTVYDWTDDEYLEVLKEKTPEIKKMILASGATSRRYKYRMAMDIARTVADQVKTKRVGVTDGCGCRKDITTDFCYDLVQELVNDGYMLSVNHGEYMLVRSLNRTEQREQKKYAKDVA